MERKIAQERQWALPNSTVKTHQHLDEDEDEDGEEETLSLSDLPLIHDNNSRKEQEINTEKTQEEFDFSSITANMSKQSEMCAADDVFFQGQILPLRRHSSVSSDKGRILPRHNHQTRPVSRSESMDHHYSGGLISSRSSSISSSHHSSSSSGSKYKYKYKPTRNQFHSHPSPSPKLHFPTKSKGFINSTNKTSPFWNIFRLGGLVTPPPEIAFQDRTSRMNLGSRNSTSSNGSSNRDKMVLLNNKKKARGGIGLVPSGCKCSVSAVRTVPSKVVILNRSVHQVEEENVPKLSAKKQMSYHRTFEWLKQLSIEDGA